MRIVHSGFDTIAFALQGALEPGAIKILRRAKETAVKEDRDIVIELGKTGRKVRVKSTGQKGGYAFVIDTGRLGETISIKDNLGRQNWNGFVKISAESLAVNNRQKAIENALKAIAEIGFVKTDISYNRIDYCVDFLTDNLSINPDNFVTHSNVKKLICYQKEPPKIDLSKRAVMRGQSIESVTLGSMPRRQVIIYDKTAQVISKRKFWWFDVWGLNRAFFKADPALAITRVEIRAAKKELEKYGIKSQSDVESHIGNVLQKIAKDIRYISPIETETNISRQPLHPLWERVQGRLKSELEDMTSTVEPETVLEVIRAQKKLEYENLIIGNMAGFAICDDIPIDKVIEELPKRIEAALIERSKGEDSRFWKTYYKAKDRLNFF